MKKMPFKFILTLWVFIILSFEAHAQKITQLTKQFEISINQGNIQKSKLEFGIEQLNFKSELEARRFFGAISDNLTGYELNYKAKTVTLILLKDNLIKPWEVVDWNKYFATKKSRYVSYFKNL